MRLVHRHIVGASDLCKGFERGDCLVPVGKRPPGYGKLLVEHQQGIVTFSNGGHKPGMHRLLVCTALFECGCRPTLGVGHLAEDVYLPRSSGTEVVGFLRLAVVVAHTNLRSEIDRRQIRQAGVHQHGLGLLHLQAGNAEIGVTLQSCGYECLQLRVGKQFAPRL